MIPCYKGVDAYDMPKEFARLQAQDMGKVGEIQDLLRGVEKILPKNDGNAKIMERSSSVTAPTVDSLMKRAFIYLEDKNWSSANEYCEKVLDIDPENAKAYIAKLLAELHVQNVEGLAQCRQTFDSSNNYKKAIRFAIFVTRYSILIII